MMINKIFTYTMKAAAVMLPLLLLTNCQEDEVDVRDKGGLPVVSVLNSFESEGKFSTFYEIMTELGVVPLYNGSGPSYEYTIFAPTNAAFEAFFERYDTYDGIGDIPDAILFDLLEYHIVEGSISSGDLGNAKTTVQGTDITFSNGMINGRANITAADRAARNGFVHEIDAVLLPPTIGQQTILEIAAANSEFSTLAAAISRFPDLVDLIDGGDGAFTVLAPTDAAFDAALAALPVSTLEEIPDPLLRVVLEYHLLDGLFTSGTIPGPQVTLGGETLNLDLEVVNTADVGATNGLVHIVDQVLLPPSLNTVVGQILTREEFSTLAAALVKTDLTTPLSMGTYTIFAPNDEAFATLLEDMGVESLDEVSDAALANILTYHVLGAEVLSTAINAGLAQTLNGAYVDIDTDMGVMVDMATVIEPDITADNGVVHEIDAVLMPPMNNVVELAANTPSLSILAAAIEKAGLIEDLQGGGPYTVFAPDNAAFDALFDLLNVSGLDELTPSQLRPILLYHVVEGRVISSELPNGFVNTLNEGTAININNAVFTINTETDQLVELGDATLNVQASNGVVHIVDTVLLP
jgi:transforming growth factor-beta-induced protein